MPSIQRIERRDPPRPVSRALALQVVLGDTLRAFAVASLGAALFWGCAGPRWLAEKWPPPAGGVLVAGVVTDVAPVTLNLNKRPVFACSVRYELAGVAHGTIAYAMDSPPAVGAHAEVRTSVADPERASVDGMSASPLGDALWGVIGGLAVGIVVFGVHLGRRLRVLRLLRDGHIGAARLDRREERVRNRKRYVLWTFSLTTKNGERRTIEVETPASNTALGDEAGEPVLFEEARGGRCVLLGSLPGDPRLDESGRFVPTGAAIAFIGPLVFLAVNVVGVVTSALT